MAKTCRITKEFNQEEQAVTLSISGVVTGEALSELEESIHEARRAAQRIYIDLSEVTLLDRAAARWLSRRDLKNIIFINCPGYLRRWITS